MYVSSLVYNQFELTEFEELQLPFLRTYVFNWHDKPLCLYVYDNDKSSNHLQFNMLKHFSEQDNSQNENVFKWHLGSNITSCSC